MKLMFVAFYTYLFVVSVRLALWTIGVLTPIIWSKIPLSLREASQQLRLLLKRMLTGSASKWRKKLLDKAVQSFEENCHFLLSMLYFFVNLAVWWQVPTVIYAEIPEANAWLTGLGVVLGVGQFGLAGVVLGPLLASVPLICYNLVKLFNTLQWHQASESSTKRPSLFNLHKDFLPGASPRRAPSMRSERSSSSDSETLQPETSARRSSPPTSPTSSISRALRAAASPEPEAPEKTAVPNGVRRRNRMP